MPGWTFFWKPCRGEGLLHARPAPRPMHRLTKGPPLHRLLAVTIAAVLALAACTSSTPSTDVSAGVGRVRDITVEVSDTRAPLLSWPDGMTFPRAESIVMWPGDGDALIDGQPLLLDVFIQSLETGEVLQNTYDGLPRPFLLAPELLGDDLYTILRKQRVGARVVSVAPPVEGFAEETTIAIVIDVLSSHAVGERVPAREDLPLVSAGSSHEPIIQLRTTAEYPTELVTATVIRGAGEQVQPQSYVLAQYKAVYTQDGSDASGDWMAGDVFDSTWGVASAPYQFQMGKGETLRAFEEGLLDAAVGSRLLIVAPETWAYPGKGPMVFVVDVLDVWTESH